MARPCSLATREPPRQQPPAAQRPRGGVQVTSPNPAEQQELRSVLPGRREPTATTAPAPRVLSASIIREVGLRRPALQGRGEDHTGLGARLGKLRCGAEERPRARRSSLFDLPLWVPPSSLVTHTQPGSRRLGQRCPVPLIPKRDCLQTGALVHRSDGQDLQLRTHRVTGTCEHHLGTSPGYLIPDTSREGGRLSGKGRADLRAPG